MHSHATWSLANCSLLLRGLNLTVTTIFSSLALEPPGVETGVLSIFSSLALGPPGVETGVLSIFVEGVPGVLTVIFIIETDPFLDIETYSNQALLGKAKRVRSFRVKCLLY